MMKKYFITIAIALLSVLAGCTKDNEAPVPPAAETLAVDFSAFDTPSTKAVATADDVDDFFTFAAVQVMSNWVNIFEQIINVPVEAYKQLLLSATPVADGNGYTWTVEYTDALNQKYTVELYGEDAGKKVNWEVRVSEDGLLGYEDFAWVTGWSSRNGHDGQWNVKANPLDTDVLVTLDWTASNTKVETVKITYDLSHTFGEIAQFFNNSYLIYSTSATDSAYDRSVAAYYNQMGLGFWMVNIEWNSITGAGRVNSQNKYGDSVWHCWDAAHTDI